MISFGKPAGGVGTASTVNEQLVVSLEVGPLLR
jgi:hypothetical protein